MNSITKTKNLNFLADILSARTTRKQSLILFKKIFASDIAALISSRFQDAVVSSYNALKIKIKVIITEAIPQFYNISQNIKPVKIFLPKKSEHRGEVY